MLKDKELSLKDIIRGSAKIIRFLRSKWIVIFIAGIIGAMTGFYIALRDVYKYTAQLTFVVEGEKGGGGGLMGALGFASQLGIDLGGSDGGGAFSGANLLELIKSRSLIEKALLMPVDEQSISTTTFADLYVEMYEWKKKWSNKPKLEKISEIGFGSKSVAGIERDSLLGVIHQRIVDYDLSIGLREKKSSLVDIKFTSPNQKFSKEFVEALIAIVGKFYVETKTQKASSNLSILQKQADSVKAELNLALGGVVKIADETFNLNPAYSINRLPSQKRQIDVQANVAILTELVKNLEIAKIDLRRETPLIQVIDTPVYPLQKHKISKALGVIFGGILASILVITALIFMFFYSRVIRNDDGSKNEEFNHEG